jgi:hypothetical protein
MELINIKPQKPRLNRQIRNGAINQYIKSLQKRISRTNWKFASAKDNEGKAALRYISNQITYSPGLFPIHPQSRFGVLCLLYTDDKIQPEWKTYKLLMEWFPVIYCPYIPIFQTLTPLDSIEITLNVNVPDRIETSVDFSSYFV